MPAAARRVHADVTHPAADADDRPVLFEATVRTPLAPMHAENRIASPMVSQQLAGHRVSILDEDGDWLEARGADGYNGWMHTGFLARAPQHSARQSRESSRISLGCVAGTNAGGERSLPLRAILAPDETVRIGEAIDVAQLAKRFPREPAAIARTAQQYFRGTSYLWGGVTPWGADCSGLAQSTFALHGVKLPRDAWQQAEVGEHAGDIDQLREADLLFFSDRGDGRITHVGISLGDRRMVHLALGRGGYALERLDDANDAYVAKLRTRFVGARRVV
jgi:hypothetical protein